MLPHIGELFHRFAENVGMCRNSSHTLAEELLIWLTVGKNSSHTLAKYYNTLAKCPSMLVNCGNSSCTLTNVKERFFHVFSLLLVRKCNFINIHDNNQPTCRNHSSYMCKNYSSYTVEVNTSFGEMCPVTPGLHTQLVFCFFYCLFILEHVDCHC